MDQDSMQDFPETSNQTEEHLPESEEGEESAAQEQKPEEMVSPEEVPLTIKVEAGRFQMPLQELMQLKPGNTIPLSQTPEQGIHLTIDGVKVASGEILQLGETLGVKITEIK